MAILCHSFHDPTYVQGRNNSRLHLAPAPNPIGRRDTCPDPGPNSWSKGANGYDTGVAWAACGAGDPILQWKVIKILMIKSQTNERIWIIWCCRVKLKWDPVLFVLHDSNFGLSIPSASWQSWQVMCSWGKLFASWRHIVGNIKSFYNLWSWHHFMASCASFASA